MKHPMPIKRLLSVGIAVSALTIAQVGMARTVRAQGAPATCTVIEISGKVDSVTGGKAVVRGFTVDLTTIKDDDTVRTPQEGQFAKVEGCLLPDGSIAAGEVDSIPAARARTKIEIAGVIEEITATSIKVGGIVFAIDTAEVQTVLAVGGIVKIEATKTGDTWLVSEVEAGTDEDVKRPEEDDSNDDDSNDDDSDDDSNDDDSDDDSNDDSNDDDSDDDSNDDDNGGDDDSNDDNGGDDDSNDDDNGGDDDSNDDDNGGDDDSNDDNGGDDDSNDDNGGDDDSNDDNGGDDDNSGKGKGGNDDNSGKGKGGNDDNSGKGKGGDDDNSGKGKGGDDDNSGKGKGGDDDGDDD